MYTHTHICTHTYIHTRTLYCWIPDLQNKERKNFSMKFLARGWHLQVGSKGARTKGALSLVVPLWAISAEVAILHQTTG